MLQNTDNRTSDPAHEQSKFQPRRQTCESTSSRELTTVRELQKVSVQRPQGFCVPTCFLHPFSLFQHVCVRLIRVFPVLRYLCLCFNMFVSAVLLLQHVRARVPVGRLLHPGDLAADILHRGHHRASFRTQLFVLFCAGAPDTGVRLIRDSVSLCSGALCFVHCPARSFLRPFPERNNVLGA